MKKLRRLGVGSLLAARNHQPTVESISVPDARLEEALVAAKLAGVEDAVIERAQATLTDASQELLWLRDEADPLDSAMGHILTTNRLVEAATEVDRAITVAIEDAERRRADWANTERRLTDCQAEGARRLTNCTEQVLALEWQLTEVTDSEARCVRSSEEQLRLAANESASERLRCGERVRAIEAEAAEARAQAEERMRALASGHDQTTSELARAQAEISRAEEATRQARLSATEAADAAKAAMETAKEAEADIMAQAMREALEATAHAEAARSKCELLREETALSHDAALAAASAAAEEARARGVLEVREAHALAAETAEAPEAAHAAALGSTHPGDRNPHMESGAAGQMLPAVTAALLKQRQVLLAFSDMC